MKYKFYDLKDLGDERGSLIPLEMGNNSPFEVRRVFYIYDTKPSTPRGAHANKNSEFLMMAVNGSCKVLIDDGFEKVEVTLDNPKKALYLNRMVWKEMFDFTEDAVLLVLSNEKYDETEYIRNYQDFL